MVPVSCFPGSTETIRPSACPPAVVNLSPARGSGRALDAAATVGQIVGAGAAAASVEGMESEA
jgi:hypothetical protein